MDALHQLEKSQAKLEREVAAVRDLLEECEKTAQGAERFHSFVMEDKRLSGSSRDYIRKYSDKMLEVAQKRHTV